MNFQQAKQQLFKGVLVTTGIGMGLGALYSLSRVYQKGKILYTQHQQEEQFNNYMQTDSRFANGYTLTKFCMDVHAAQKEINK